MKKIFLKTIEEDGVRMMRNKNENISVIIRVKNEEQWIGHAIQSILDNIKSPEIIIIDNNSTDNSLNIINNFKQDEKLEIKKNNNYTKIKIFNIKNYSPGKSLNLGVKKASNNNILIISSHCVLINIDLKKHILDLKKYVCVFGKQNPIWFGKKITKRYIWSHFTNKKIVNMFSKLENRYFLHNAVAFYQKKFLIKNPFNENLTGKEDRYWAELIIKKKKSFLYDPSIEVNHHYTPNGNTWKGIG